MILIHNDKRSDNFQQFIRNDNNKTPLKSLQREAKKSDKYTRVCNRHNKERIKSGSLCLCQPLRFESLKPFAKPNNHLFLFFLFCCEKRLIDKMGISFSTWYFVSFIHFYLFIYFKLIFLLMSSLAMGALPTTIHTYIPYNISRNAWL